MTVTMQSLTDTEIEYALTINADGIVTDCQCPDFHYRHHACKHIIAKQQELDALVARAMRFLGVKLAVQGMMETWKANREMAWMEW